MISIMWWEWYDMMFMSVYYDTHLEENMVKIYFVLGVPSQGIYIKQVIFLY